VIAVRLLADGVVVREAVFRGAEVTIGRGPESDFAIVDPSVSRRHARVRSDETGSVWIEDAGGRNGLRIAGRRLDRAEVGAAAPLRCQLGAVELEIALSSPFDTQEIAAPTPFAHGPLRVMRATGLFAAIVAAVACNTVLEPGFWSPWNQERLSSLVQSTVGVAMAVPVLAFVLFGLLRVVRRKARVSDALRSMAVVSWTWVLLAVLLRGTAYLLPVSWHSLFQTLLTGATSAVTIGYLATTARRGPNRRFFLVWAGAIAVVVTAFAGAAHLTARQTGAPQVDHEMQMPVAGFSGPTTDLDRYLDGLRSDYAAAERAAAEERRYSAARK
jgi:hypothetical protein